MGLPVFAAVGQPASDKGRLCVGDACVPGAYGHFALEVSETERPFVWASEDNLRVIAGTIPPGANVASLDSDRTVRKITIVTSDGRRPPPAAQFEVIVGKSSWRWPVPEVPSKPIALDLPRGDATLKVRSDGYRLLQARLSGDERLFLRRLPVLSGMVVDGSTRLAIVGADIQLPSGELLVRTTADGRFRAAVEPAWPAAVRILAPGYAARLVAVPKAVADTDIPIISMSRGGSVEIQIDPPLSSSEQLTWEVRKLEGRDEQLVREGAMERGQSRAMISGIEPGRYQLVMRGEEPLQRYGTVLLVKDGDIATAKIQIRPLVVEFKTLFGDAVLPDANVELHSDGGGWKASVRTDENGKAAGELWQQGMFTVAVRALPMKIWATSKELAGDTRVKC